RGGRTCGLDVPPADVRGPRPQPEGTERRRPDARRRLRAEAWPAPIWRPARAHQAALLTRIGHPDLAERLWESTMQLDAPGPWAGLGHAQLAGGFLAEAAKSFSRAAQMGEPGAELHRAEALAAGGDYSGAAAACDAQR